LRFVRASTTSVGRQEVVLIGELAAPKGMDDASAEGLSLSKD
jgi:hypothetical protein